MVDAGKNRELVQRAVNEVLAAALPRLRDELTEQVLRQLGLALRAAGDNTGTDRLKTAVASIYEAATQGDVLNALLDGAAAFCGRAALFVVRGGSGAGWQGRGFRDNDMIKTLALDLSMGLCAHALQQRLPLAGPAAHFDSRLSAALGPSSDGQCHIVPLVIRDKVAAIVYMDAGTQAGGRMDTAAAETLVRTAGTWLELLALRKSAAAPTGATQPAGLATTESAVPPVEPPYGSSEDELHRKARRFAKLLVDEIKLYNDAKVREGKQHRDLYDRLKDDIDKSRASFDQRYASTMAAGADYFTRELISNLADNDPSLLGSNFHR